MNTNTRFLLIIICIVLTSCSKKENNLVLNFADEVSSKDIRIKMEVLASVPKTQIYDGQSQYKIPNGYGENEWYFTYHDSLNGYFRHIKTNRNDSHNYIFNFYREGTKCFVNIKIGGASQVEERIELK